MRKFFVLIFTVITYLSYGQNYYQFLPSDVFRPGQQMPDPQFRRIVARQFSYLTLGNNTSTPLVSNFSLDIVDAKFELNGGTPLDRRNISMLSLSLKGDKNGNIATLFSGDKVGGNFEGELKLHFRLFTRFFYNGESSGTLVNKIRSIEYTGNSDYKRAMLTHYNPAYSSSLNADTTDKGIFERLGGYAQLVLDSLAVTGGTADAATTLRYNALAARWNSLHNRYTNQSPNYVSDTLSRVAAKVQANKNKVYDEATWSSSHLLWLTPKASFGGETFYTINRKDSLSYYNDTAIKNKNFIYTLALDLNYYYTNYNWLTFYANIGIGISRSSNLAQLSDKYSVTYGAKGADTLTNKSFSQDRSTSIKYDAYLGKNEVKLYFVHYANLYALFTPTQTVGLHLFNEVKYHDKDNLVNTTGIGIIANVSSKKESKNILGIEAYLKLRTDKKVAFDFNNEQSSEVGLQFNVPIVAFTRIR